MTQAVAPFSSSSFQNEIPAGRCSLLVMNGPNLASVGIRQPEIYGTEGLEVIPLLVDKLLGPASRNVRLSFFQSNCEGALIDRLEEARKEGVHGVALNAGEYTHSSLALADCIAWIGIPVVEVHISNVFARNEAIRQQSYLGAHVIGVIAGFGITSYALAVQALYTHLALRS
jgi:3-dehydroquinate dehydratase-2